jgi:GAF domain-containing protein
MDAVPVGSLSDLLACVAAFGRSLDEAFDPQRFLAEFSARVQRLVPHDRVIIVRREEDGHTCSVFAAYAVRGTLIGNPSHYTTAFSRGDRLAPAELLLTEVFEGNAQVVSDMAEDSRFREHPFGVKIIEAGLRARLSVPFHAGGRLAGAFIVASATAGLYTEAHTAVCRQIADLIGPFIETVVVLHRERRRRERLKAVTALPPLLGASLKVGDVLERLGEAVRPLIDFDIMGLRLRDASGEGFARIGSLRVRDTTGEFERTGVPGGSHPAHPEMATIEDYSVSDRLSRGEPVLIRDAERELDGARNGDRRLIKGGGRSVLAVPLLFGEEVGGCLFFGDRRVNWYDETDVEIAAAIASQVVLAVQHQRLAEEQRRAAVAEEQARTVSIPQGGPERGDPFLELLRPDSRALRGAEGRPEPGGEGGPQPRRWAEGHVHDPHNRRSKDDEHQHQNQHRTRSPTPQRRLHPRYRAHHCRPRARRQNVAQAVERGTHSGEDQQPPALSNTMKGEKLWESLKESCMT